MGTLAAVCVVASGCAADRPVSPEVAYQITIASGNFQIGPSLGVLASPLAVRVTDARGDVVKGVRVRFSVDRATSSTATLVDSIVVTGPDGVAGAWLRLGSVATAQEALNEPEVGVRAWIAAAPSREVRFSATRHGASVLDSIVPRTARPGDPVLFLGKSLGGSVVRAHFGDVVVPIASTAANPIPAAGGVGMVTVPACVASGVIDFWIESDGRVSNAVPLTVQASQLPLNLSPHQSVTLPASRIADCVSLAGDGATYLVSGQFASVGAAVPVQWDLGAGSSPAEAALAAEPTTARRRSATIAHREFEARIRSLEGVLAPSVRADRARPRAASLVAPPSSGSLRNFRVVAKTDGSAFTTVTGRLRYTGARLLVYTDTSDDAFLDPQLRAIASLYDNHLVGEAVRVFGAEPDVDGDGRIIVLFTPAVNRLVRRENCLPRGFVTGFFYPVDQLERDVNSNRGEIFYALVPDPTDRYSCTHTTEDVVRIVQATFLHEMQHLISFNQRVLARGASIEDPWLSEGLSHMSEELGSRLFEVRYPAPLGRTSTAQLFPDSAAPFIAPQMLNAYVYLFFALNHSVTSYDDNGSLEERGAAWLFLRWLADQKGEGILRRLVQTTRKGVENIESVSGESFGELFGDFSMALFADSLPGYARSVTAPRLRFTTRNVRQLMAREATISGFEQPFPITTYLLERDVVLRSAMLPGTMMHAILRSKPGEGRLRLFFRARTGQSLNPALGAQVSILRLP